MTSLLLAAALGAAMGGCCSATNPSPSVAIFLEFQSQPPDLSVDEMKSVVDEIYKPAAVRFDWRHLSSFRTGETFPEVVVVKFRGNCVLKGCLLGWKEPAFTRELKPLGYTASSDGQVLPFVTMFCERILDTITPSAVTMEVDARAKLVGRALGRVLAHELYHVLTHTTHHARTGVLKPYHTRLDLVGEQLEFEAAQLDALRDHADKDSGAVATGY